MIDIIIPVWNLKERGIDRVWNSVYSLSFQAEYINKIIIVDGSTPENFDFLAKRLAPLQGLVIHQYYPLKEYNQPKLFNRGIAMSKAEYIMTTGADFLFSRDFLGWCMHYRDPDKLLHKEVKMLPKIHISKYRIEKWEFPDAPYNQYGKRANGGCQYATSEFFKKVGYDERLSGFGCMDNMLAYQAIINDMHIHWIAEGEILHQWHTVKRTEKDLAQTQNNIRITEQFMAKHNLKNIK